MLPYIKSVRNTEITSGGADIESDENLAERIYLAPSGYSVAGPDDAYEYHTMAYNQDIIDVKVSSPAPTEVEIRFLIGEGEIPTGTVIKGLEEYLQDNNIRPLTDRSRFLHRSRSSSASPSVITLTGATRQKQTPYRVRSTLPLTIMYDGRPIPSGVTSTHRN